MQEVVTCVTGIVESSSRRMGNRSKTLLKKGQSLGERAILEGEPAGESCTAGSPVVALIVNRQAAGHACLLSLWSEGRPILKWESVREFLLCRQPCPGPSCQSACHALLHIHSACLLHLCTVSMHATHSVMLLPCLPSGCPSCLEPHQLLSLLAVLYIPCLSTGKLVIAPMWPLYAFAAPGKSGCPCCVFLKLVGSPAGMISWAY